MPEADLTHTTSRGGIILPPARPRPRQFTDIELAHCRLVAEIAGLKPNLIRGNADRFDVMARADHLRAVFAAVTTYAKAIVADTARSIPIILRDQTSLLEAAAGDVVDAVLIAQDRMQDLAAAEED
jgi:hypothetical protein